MKLKSPEQFSRWRFYCETPDGEELKLPIDSEYAASREALEVIVFDQFKAFGKPYIAQIEIQAAKLNLRYTTYIKRSMEHQVCLREENPALCWNDGFGDEIHSALTAVDDLIERTPAKIKAAAQSIVKTVTKLGTGAAKAKFQGCVGCGGTKTFVAKQANLGRAGALNNYVPTTLRKKQRT